MKKYPFDCEFESLWEEICFFIFAFIVIGLTILGVLFFINSLQYIQDLLQITII